MNKKRKQGYSSRSIRQVILFSFSAIFAVIIFSIALFFNNIFYSRTREMLTESVQSASSQEVVNIETYLTSMRNIGNALYYDVIKQTDASSPDLAKQISLLYASNSNEIATIALFDEDGNLLVSSPQSQLKPNLDVKQQEWFTNATSEVENFHFSEPHVQNLFTSSDYAYPWVISLSSEVELNDSTGSRRGILLIDMNYLNLQQLMENSNSAFSDCYTYLVSNEGNIIYHPLQNQIQYGIHNEDTVEAMNWEDGVHEEVRNGERRIDVVESISYTGWKLVSVIPESAMKTGQKPITYLILMITCFAFALMLIINRAVASYVSGPLIRLNDAIANMENVRNIPPEIYEGSSREVGELGNTLHSYIAQINRMSDEMLAEEEEKRKTELDALQAQINPHFLYNTLDSIVWMIEGGKNEEAVYMITQLASFFRMSLNRGKSIISIQNELKQAKAYLAIQKIRYKQSFEDTYDIRDGIENCLIVKLVIQPILENAIYHGIKEADQDGEIHIAGWREGDDIYISISDNGYGMSEEELQNILTESTRPAVEKHGSGVGLINVDKRLRLRFGDAYGLKVESELDEGTTVTIHIPAIEATEENMKRYEEGGRR